MYQGRQIDRRRLILPLILATGLGCAHIPQQSESAKRAEIEASTAELRTRVVELGRDAMREVEVAADSIDARTTDDRIRRNTLLLRLSTVPAATEAALRQDPIVATVDVYAFRLQLASFLSSPLGYSSFGADAVIGQRAMARFGERWEEVAKAVGANLTDENRARVLAWADAHPIERLPFTRPSVVGDLAKVLRDKQASIGAAVGGIQESIDRLEYRASILNEYAIKQGNWISQYAAIEMRSSPEASELTQTLSETRNLVEETPEMVARERVAVLADVERQRLETLATLAQERATVLQALADERAIVVEAIDQQRRLAMLDADSLRVRAVSDAIRVVDHLMLRVAELLAVLLGAVIVALFLLRRRASPALRPPAEGQRAV